MLKNWMQVLKIATPCLICLTLGFYIGFKVKPSEGTAQSEQITESTKVKIVEKSLPEVYFFKTEEKRECPADYTIKAKFGTDLPVFYTTENKFYDRVKPELCFTSSESAKKLGFTEKK
jgi:hypothetical protein